MSFHLVTVLFASLTFHPNLPLLGDCVGGSMLSVVRFSSGKRPNQIKFPPFLEFLFFCITFVTFNVTGHVYAIYHQYIKRRLPKEQEEEVASSTKQTGVAFEVRKESERGRRIRMMGNPDILKHLNSKQKRKARVKCICHPRRYWSCTSGYEASCESDD